MFHRPKSDDKSAELAAAPKKAEAMPAGPFGGARTAPPVGPQAVKAEPPKSPFAATKPAIETKPMIDTSPATPAEAKVETPKPEETAMADDKSTEKPPARPLDIPGSPNANYQTQPARAQSPNFTSPTYSPLPATAQNMANAAQKTAGRRLVIGQGISLSGEIEACEFLVIEGTVEAALKGASVLEIAESGVFYGTVEINEATVAGRFEGDITCNGRLTITATGSVTGTVAYKELAIEAGATLDGKVNPLGGSKVGAGKKPERQAKKAAPRNDNAGDTGVELPLTGTNNG